jgi:hypothetical protein
MLSPAGQCGIDTSTVGLLEVAAVATMNRPPGYEHLDLSESSLYSASTLNLFGLPYDFASLRSIDPPPRAQRAAHHWQTRSTMSPYTSDCSLGSRI